MPLKSLEKVLRRLVRSRVLSSASWMGSLVVLAGGCGTYGNGVLRHEPRTVSPFTAVKIETGVEATVVIAAQQPLDLSGDDNLLPLIETTVQGNVLSVGVVKSNTIHPSLPLRVQITTPSLVAVTATSGSDVTADGVQPTRMDILATGGSVVTLTQLVTDDVVIDEEGASRVTLSGTGKRITMTLAGGSSVTSTDFMAETLTVNASGASKGNVRASASVSGSLSGSSTFTVLGNPSVRDIAILDSSTVTYQ